MVWRLSFFLIVLFSNVNLVQAEKVTLRLGLEQWPPYMDRYQPENGVAAEIVVTALKRAGYQVNSRFDDWSNTLQGTGMGVLDVIVAGWYSDRRNEQFVYSEPYLFNRISFIKRKDKSYQYNTLDDLRGVLIGTVSQYAYGKEFDESSLLIKMPANHIIQNLSLLQQGKIDLTLDDELALRHQLQTYMPGTSEQFEFLPKPLTVQGLHMLVSRKRSDQQDIVAAFNQAIKEMKQDGSFKAILAKYETPFRFLIDKE